MTTPAEIAREALRQLASRRVPPTPDNYRALYNEIAGVQASPAAANPAAESHTGAIFTPPPSSADSSSVQELLADVLDAVQLMVIRNAALRDDVATAARAARYAATGELLRALAQRVGDLIPRLRESAAAGEALHDALVRLLQLALRASRESTGNTTSVDTVMATLERLLEQQLDLHSLQQAERSLRELLSTQGELRQGLDDVKNSLKEMAGRFVSRLGDWCACTGSYHDRLAGYAERIARTDDVKELNRLLHEVMRETKLVQTSADSSRLELLAAQRDLEIAQDRIRDLETALARATRKMREDNLTGMLNRYGVEDDFQREANRADREGEPLCVALLDIDDFKRFNDLYGHQGGDKALVYLARVMGQNARKGDVVARFGGEEFLILLPNTELDAAYTFVTRLQHALTRHLFLHKNDQVLITFSCGVAQRQAGESREAVIERVDKALYEAKRSGKNRVCTAR